MFHGTAPVSHADRFRQSNRLVSAGGVTYTYDAENNRIAMESDRHKETYVVDTVSSSMSRVLTITDGSGTTTLCIYGQGLICEKTGDIYQYHHYNNLGSTMKLTDAKGGVTASFTYGTYGELLSGSTGFTRFLYNGRCGVTTDDNGFYYMRQRYYSPELKRFVNQDVIKGSLNNSQSLNRYSYVQGNPVSYTDPFGLSPKNGLFTGASFWHGVLGLLGCIPGPIGAIANFIDCGIYLAQGDYFGAALCFMNGVTMGATTVASTLIKAGKLCSVANTALRVAMVSERIAGGLTFAQNFYNIGQTGIQMYCKYGIMGESLGLDTAGEVLGIGLSAMGCIGGLHDMGNTSKELLALQKKVDAGMLCFVAGTKVKTLDGDRNIEDITVGDEVWSCDVETGETGGKCVTRLSVNEFSDIAHVTIDGETIDATTTHPFYVEGYGFKPAGQLIVGEKVRLLDGGTGEVEAVIVEHLEEPVKVYNFEVEDWHTYYVAELGVLVHNGCISEFDVLPYGEFNTPQNVGDELTGHELLQSAWLKAHGKITNRNDTLSKLNPAIALKEDPMHKAISKMQSKLGYYDRNYLAGASWRRNVLDNIQILKEVGMSREKILELAKATREFAIANNL